MPVNQDLLINRINENTSPEGELCLVECDFKDEYLIELVEALKCCKNVTVLDLSGNRISDKGAICLANLLKEPSCAIKSLNISSNNIGAEGCKALAGSNLQSLNISANSVGNDIAAFASMPSLRNLSAAECGITDTGAKTLFNSSSIKKLNLSTNKIIGTSLKNIQQNTTLEELDLSQNDLENKNLSYFISNKTLLTLNLTNTFTGDEGVGYLAQNKSLKELILIQCVVTDKGAQSLSENKALEKLVLFSNKVSDTGAKALANHMSLLHLDLQDNFITDKTIPNILRNYQENHSQVFTRTKDFLLKKNELTPVVASSPEYGKSYTPSFKQDKKRPLVNPVFPNPKQIKSNNLNN